ncbi:protein containing NfeD-like domain [Sulfurimonas gotlandica GD1]|uniref:Protein containing NfeD-like domain n=1 Tax=Sulfurimonas gotlandica (strain DSM 19862 / JCM 16533 / GD1) TaxID=929558 RepID=B6BGG9_SULGG|nr:nodulation protein NfeD [Sulfurimonas gotlandica]EDZ63299.1 membrane-bound serine protease [Sulfurimonas gotlandica GD1]EHP29597.1 protein containing NfeD-like domain [Sulfurimonas gotlandica GD1]
MKRLLFLLFLIILPLFSASPTVVKLEISGAIGPATSSYLKEGIASAISHDVQMILIELDTPGGLSTSMREMIQDILNSPISVATYVYPKGARAASAGTYLLYASHVAAMAPGTNLGAATPVSIMPGQKTADANSSISTLEKKAINDATAYIKSLAQLNDRNISWAIEAVKEAESLSAEDALKSGVIDLMANNTEELLAKLHGRVVKVANQNHILNTKDANIINYEANFKTRFLSIITNPNMAYIFLLIAIYGIFFELMNPGAIFPGVLGGIAGVIALYALNIIPFNYAGLALIILGIAFMVAEVFITGFGVLGIGGVISFAFGSILLFDADTLGSSVSIPLILALTIVSLGFFVLVIRLFISSRSAKIVSGAEELVGALGEVIEVNENSYHVYCHGEAWSAKSKSKLSAGQRVEVIRLSGLTLEVKPIKE